MRCTSTTVLEICYCILKTVKLVDARYAIACALACGLYMAAHGPWVMGLHLIAEELSPRLWLCPRTIYCQNSKSWLN